MTALRLALFVILATDPWGCGLVLRAAGRDRPVGDLCRSAGLAAVASTALLALAALVSEPLLGALRVSAEAAALAAGVILVVPALARVWRGPDRALVRVALSRRDLRRAALVPLAFPLLAGPGPLAAAVAWSAVYGSAPSACGVAVALVPVGLLLAAAGRSRGEAATVVWARVSAAGIVIVAADLAADGVLGIA